MNDDRINRRKIYLNLTDSCHCLSLYKFGATLLEVPKFYAKNELLLANCKDLNIICAGALVFTVADNIQGGVFTQLIFNKQRYKMS